MYLDMLKSGGEVLKEGREPVLPPLADPPQRTAPACAVTRELRCHATVRLALYKRLAAAPANAAIELLTEEIVEPPSVPCPAVMNLLARGPTSRTSIGIRHSIRARGGDGVVEKQNVSTERRYGWRSIPIVITGCCSLSCGLIETYEAASASSSPKNLNEAQGQATNRRNPTTAVRQNFQPMTTSGCSTPPPTLSRSCVSASSL